MTHTEAKRTLNAAIANFKAMPSAFHFRALKRAMLAYQEAELGGVLA